MSAGVTIAIAAATLAIGLAAGWWLPPHGRRLRGERPRPVRNILVPFAGQTISRRALEAAVRLARAENAVIMPAFLARVPRNLSLDAPLPRQCETGMPLLEAIEQRAAAQGIPVDSRVSRGRSYRDALQHLLDEETFDRIIISTTGDERSGGLDVRDLEWLLQRVPAEIIILRPAPTDHREITAAGLTGHF